jgi:hypothetical protein
MGVLADSLRQLIEIQKEQDAKLMADLDGILKSADKLSAIADEMCATAQEITDLDE